MDSLMKILNESECLNVLVEVVSGDFCFIKFLLHDCDAVKRGREIEIFNDTGNISFPVDSSVEEYGNKMFKISNESTIIIVSFI